MTELKNCPFCGGKAYIDTFGGWHIDAFHTKDCVVKPDTYLQVHNCSIAKQIKAWNRRAKDE